MIYTVTLNPALDKTVTIPDFTLDTVNRIATIRKDPGGKGINVSKVIDKLGGSSKAFGILGGACGKEIASMLEGEGFTCDFTFVEGETRTNLKVIDPVKNENTDINEPGVVVNDEIINDMTKKLCDVIVPGDIVVLAGSIPKGAPKDTYKEMVKACREAGAKVFLDAAGDLLASGIEGGPYLIKPNNDELSRMVGKTLSTNEELVEAAQVLRAKGVEKVVVSLGGKGALYITADKVIYAEGLKVKVGSTVGAGDSVVAALAYAENEGMTLEEAVKLSTATGAANVMQSGTQAAEKELVDSLIGNVVYHVL